MNLGSERRRRAALTRLSERIGALSEAAALSEGRVEDDVVDYVKGITERADQRLAFSGDNTIVALAGATGSGKSSLFNALAGAQLARSGVQRPTTRRAMAACWGPSNPDRLLDWLRVPVRTNVGPGKGLDGLVLLDLPDHDSTERENRLEVDRLVALVDMLVWVVDPQKYADAALHEGYLRPMADHADVMVVVLNQADRLTGPQLDQATDDLRRLLDSEGLREVPLLCLPGNPVSVLVSFTLVVAPALAILAGHREAAGIGATGPRASYARAATVWKGPVGRRQYVPVRVVGAPSPLPEPLPPAPESAGPAQSALSAQPAPAAPSALPWVEPTHRLGSGSHLVSSLSPAEALAVVNEETAGARPGDVVGLIPLPSPARP